MSTAPDVRLRRSNDRAFEDFGWTDNWMTFSFSDYRDPEWVNFGPLRVIVENHIEPHSGFAPHHHRDVEIVTYVVSGTLTHKDSFGHEADVRAGEMQLISAGSRGMTHSEKNRQDYPEHNLQIWFVPGLKRTEFAYHQKGFRPEERLGRFRLYVSPDGSEGSMRINQDVKVYDGLFETGDKVQHRLGHGRGVWVQVVAGELHVAGITVMEGDGAGITNTEVLDLEFNAPSEVLLFDVRMDAPMIWR